jgi:hypothetical protein
MGTVKAIVGFLLVVFVGYSLFQVVPPLMANYNFQDDLRQVAMIDGNALQKTDDDVRSDVMRRVKDHDLPIDPKQVTVQRINTPGLAAVYVAADYSVTVSLPGYAFDMHFTPNSGNK